MEKRKTPGENRRIPTNGKQKPKLLRLLPQVNQLLIALSSAGDKKAISIYQRSGNRLGFIVCSGCIPFLV